MKTLCTFIVAALILAGCASGKPISADFTKDLRAGEDKKLGGIFSVEDGFKEAKFNFDNAILVGALAKDDPGAACLDEVMTGLGLMADAPVPPSFMPKETTLIGRASVLYIRARQVQKLTSEGKDLPASCEQFIGKIVIDVARANAGAAPGGGLLPKIR